MYRKAFGVSFFNIFRNNFSGMGIFCGGFQGVQKMTQKHLKHTQNQENIKFRLKLFILNQNYFYIKKMAPGVIHIVSII